MNRIHRYVFRHLAIATAVAVAVLVFAIWLTQSLRLIQVIVDGGAPITMFFKLVVLAMPEFLITVLPIGYVGGVIFIYNKLLMDSEMVVMRAVGMGPFALARPALVVGAIVTALVYLLTLYVWPISSKEFRRLRSEIGSDYATVFMREGQFNTIDEHLTAYFRERLRSGELLGVLIHDTRDPARPVTVIAERGVMIPTPSGPRVLMFNGSRQQAEADTGRLNVLYFDQYAIDLEVMKSGLEDRWIQPDERFVGELLFLDPNNRDDQLARKQLISEGHRRITSGLWVPAFAFVALSALLAGEFNRRGQGLRIVAAVVALVMLQALSLSLTSLARSNLGFVPAMYAAPLLTCLAAGALMVQRAPRRWPHHRRPAAVPAA